MDGLRVHGVPGRQASKMPRENGQAVIAVRQDLVGKDKKSMDGGVILQCRQYGIRWTNSQVYAFDDGTKWLQSGDFEGRIHTRRIAIFTVKFWSRSHRIKSPTPGRYSVGRPLQAFRR